MTAANVMDSAAALLNDTALSVFTYVKQIPYLNMALNELQEFFELNDIPATDTLSAALTIAAGVTSIGFSPATPVPGVVYLPSNFIEPQIVWESNSGSYSEMKRVEILPLLDSGVQQSNFGVYVWASQELRFNPSIQSNNIKIHYLRSLFIPITASGDVITVVNAQSFLQFRTGALVAEFVGENKSRADELNGFASLALDRVIGIGVKGRQILTTRRRPFRSNYKSQ